MLRIARELFPGPNPEAGASLPTVASRGLRPALIQKRFEIIVHLHVICYSRFLRVTLIVYVFSRSLQSHSVQALGRELSRYMYAEIRVSDVATVVGFQRLPILFFLREAASRLSGSLLVASVVVGFARARYSNLGSYWSSYARSSSAR